jgi:hypothetical protein
VLSKAVVVGEILVVMAMIKNIAKSTVKNMVKKRVLAKMKARKLVAMGINF